ncbi:thermonuclease family protein [Nanoarchaeota archaeon]
MRRTVKRVLDGDTFETLRKINGSNRVRLANVNAPERGSSGGRKATNVLRGMIGGKTVTVNPVGRSYGRTVAKVSSDRRSVNRRMNRKGY